MGQPTLDVVGIGNALVDVLSHELDDFVERLGLAKGAMTLVDADRSAELYDALAQHVEVSGGSAANTLAGVAAFGGRAGYIGLVHDDALGVVFAHDMRQVQVSYSTPFAPQGPTTGRCIIVVTPDAERTMSTCLGASSLLGPDDLDLDLIRSAQVTYLEGYLFDSPTSKDAFRLAAATAHEAGRQVALTLSDSFCVDRHRDEFLALVTEGVDLLFANEAEITSLFEVETFGEAVDRVRGVCEIACLTQQGEGFGHRHQGRSLAGACGPHRQGGRHDGGWRPLCGRCPLRLHRRHGLRSLWATRLAGRRRSHRTGRSPSRALVGRAGRRAGAMTVTQATPAVSAPTPTRVGARCTATRPRPVTG